jgi:1-deoxy-D-xylulose-5-phosphate reductoisomerase
MLKRLAILGSTGSIGRNALRLVELYPERLEVATLAARGDSPALREQCRKYRPRFVALGNSGDAGSLRREFPGLRVGVGREALVEAVSLDEVDLVLVATSGSAGLVPTYHAVRNRKNVALANKETVVMAGDLLMPLAASQGVSIIPVDSEHSALHQCLRGTQPSEVKRLILTASGGPFLNHSAEQLGRVEVEQALAHPTWSMGPKITVDSATLMNKGLEVIEARHFFGVPPERVSVVVHPQSVVHSLVEFVDGTLLAQMSITDMRSSLLYAFAFPERWESRLPELDLFSLPALRFQKPDTERFPCLELAYSALREGGTAPTVLNAANEVAVQLFLDHKLPFLGIPALIARVLENHRSQAVESLEQVLEVDRVARLQAADQAARLAGQAVR